MTSWDRAKQSRHSSFFESEVMSSKNFPVVTSFSFTDSSVWSFMEVVTYVIESLFVKAQVSDTLLKTSYDI